MSGYRYHQRRRRHYTTRTRTHTYGKRAKKHYSRSFSRSWS